MFPTFYVSKVAAATVWAEQQKLTEPVPADENYFGQSVSIENGTILVGATFGEGSNTDSGAAYVYVKSGGTWVVQQQLTSSATNAGLGFSVSIDQDTAVVGAPYDSTIGTEQGAAYVYTRSGTTWTQQQKLVASDGENSAQFGISVAVIGDTIVVGAHKRSVMGVFSPLLNAGAAYVFTRTAGTWTQQQKLISNNPQTAEVFGTSVSIDTSTNTIAIGAPGNSDGGSQRGAAYMFTESAGVWGLQQKLYASDEQDGNYFGVSVSVESDTVLIGAMYGEGIVGNTGAAYIFTRSGSTWTEQQKLYASDGTSADLFGRSVSLNGTTLLIGSEGDDDTPSNSGAAYIFTLSGGTWTETQKLTAADADNDDLFGYSVSLDGNTLVVGAYREDGSGSNRGAAYVFGL